MRRTLEPRSRAHRLLDVPHADAVPARAEEVLPVGERRDGADGAGRGWERERREGRRVAQVVDLDRGAAARDVEVRTGG